MSRKHQVMACGACAVTFDESGQATTSVDILVTAIKHLFVRSARLESTKPVTVSL